MNAKANGLDLKSPTIVESIIKRKNGSNIKFGHGHHRLVEYLFKPIDANVKDSPHVCDVPNDKHRNQLLQIPEGFRLYNQPDDQTDSDEDDQDDDTEKGNHDGVDYEDLLGFNADQLSTDFLKAYAKDHLKISNSAKAPALAYAKDNYALELDGTATVITLLREIFKAEQALQQKESEAAKLANK